MPGYRIALVFMMQPLRFALPLSSLSVSVCCPRVCPCLCLSAHALTKNKRLEGKTSPMHLTDSLLFDARLIDRPAGKKWPGAIGATCLDAWAENIFNSTWHEKTQVVKGGTRTQTVTTLSSIYFALSGASRPRRASPQPTPKPRALRSRLFFRAAFLERRTSCWGGWGLRGLGCCT